MRSAARTAPSRCPWVELPESFVRRCLKHLYLAIAVTLEGMCILSRAAFCVLSTVLLACTLPAQQATKPTPAQPATSALDPGSVANGVYRNNGFRFTYKIPFGWVNRTQEMSEDSNDSS